MVRPNAAGAHPSSLFRMIKVPVARQHHEGALKPNPTITKKLGGYHRRVIDQNKTKKPSIINVFKSAFRKIKEAFRLPPSPLVRRIQELEDDIRLLQQKNAILEKGYTIEAGHDGENSSSETGEESTKAMEDMLSGDEGAADVPFAVISHQSTVVAVSPSAPVVGEDAAIGGLAVPVPPPAPPLPSFGGVPVAPPAPPITAAPAPSSRAQAQMRPVAEPAAATLLEPSAVQNPSAGGGGGAISLNDILRVQLRPVQPIRKATEQQAGRITVEDLFSVPLKPVRRRGRPAAREDSDNEDFRILRAAMKQRIESLYSPSVSVAASDREWSVSPGVRSRQAPASNLSSSVPT